MRQDVKLKIIHLADILIIIYDVIEVDENMVNGLAFKSLSSGFKSSFQLGTFFCVDL